ncbi:MAG TPA: NAD(P)H-binding protein [Solirubrobacteraceae bacterium]|nr:NAD(P)H-binding protein [Solirubrobacteraceae bacterium]
MHVARPDDKAVGRPLVVAGGSRGTGMLVASLGRSQGRVVRVVEAPEAAGSLRAAIAGAEGVVLVPAREAVSVAAQARAIVAACPDSAPRTPHLVLVSGFSVAHGHAHALNTPERLKDLMTAEQVVRCSGRRYTIVRPTWLTSDPPGRYALTLSQDSWADGMLPRADLARICLASLDEPQARGKTFAAFAEPGPGPVRWAGTFAALTTDPPVGA